LKWPLGKPTNHSTLRFFRKVACHAHTQDGFFDFFFEFLTQPCQEFNGQQGIKTKYHFRPFVFRVVIVYIVDFF